MPSPQPSVPAGDQLPGVPESAPPQGVDLPAGTPPAPWRCRVEAVVWWHRAAVGSGGLLPTGLRPGPPVAVGAFVRYLDSPVGAYDEVLACPHLLTGGRLHLPFIAVDSLPSVAAGRAHWSLPKTLASFRRTGAEVRAEGPAAGGWSVAVTAGPVGPWWPLPGMARLTQVDRDGSTSSSTTRAAVLGRLARVDVTSSAGLAPWLLPGRHHGAVLRGRIVVGAARRRGA